jgi:hypothetical protein
VTLAPAVAICTHAVPFHLYTRKLVSLFELSTHENAMDDDESAFALSPLGAVGGVEPCVVVAVLYELAQLVPAPFCAQTVW